MKNGLYDLFKKTLDQLPNDFDADPFVFSADSLPKIPEVMDCDLFYVSIGEHYYGTHYRVQSASFFLGNENTKVNARLLALWVLSALFHNQTLKLNLTHEDSTISQLSVAFDYQQSQAWSGFIERPIQFEYSASWLEPRRTFPFPPDGDTRKEILMDFYLLPENETQFNEQQDWDKKNVLLFSGTSVALLAFSELLLNYGCEQNQLPEVHLENDYGYGGVGNSSLEVSFYNL